MSFTELVRLFQGCHFEDQIFFALIIHHAVFQDFFQCFFGNGYPDDAEILDLGSFPDVGFFKLWNDVKCLRFEIWLCPRVRGLQETIQRRAGQKNRGRLPLENPIFLNGRSATLAGVPLPPSLHGS
jgi:hypothetical protein